jgi:NADH-quinone oxidoreductase subunit C/D
METTTRLTDQLKLRFSDLAIIEQSTKDDILTLWLPLDKLKAVLFYLKKEIPSPFLLLYDITAID